MQQAARENSGNPPAPATNTKDENIRSIVDRSAALDILLIEACNIRKAETLLVAIEDGLHHLRASGDVPEGEAVDVRLDQLERLLGLAMDWVHPATRKMLAAGRSALGGGR